MLRNWKNHLEKNILMAASGQLRHKSHKSHKTAAAFVGIAKKKSNRKQKLQRKLNDVKQ